MQLLIIDFFVIFIIDHLNFLFKQIFFISINLSYNCTSAVLSFGDEKFVYS